MMKRAGLLVVFFVLTIFLPVSALADSESDARNDARKRLEGLKNKGRSSVEEQFFSAVAAGDRAKVEQFIREGVNVNAKEQHGGTTLTLASGLGHKEIVQLLIANGADVKDASPLIAAVVVGYKDMINLLIAKGADINALAAESSLTPLFAAIVKGDIEMTKFLIDKGADVNRKTNIGNQVMSPLAWALENRKQDIAQLLTTKGAKQ